MDQQYAKVIGLWSGKHDLSQNFGMTETGEDVMRILCYAARNLSLIHI